MRCKPTLQRRGMASEVATGCGGWAGGALCVSRKPRLRGPTCRPSRVVRACEVPTTRHIVGQRRFVGTYKRGGSGSAVTSQLPIGACVHRGSRHGRWWTYRGSHAYLVIDKSAAVAPASGAVLPTTYFSRPMTHAPARRFHHRTAWSLRLRHEASYLETTAETAGVELPPQRAPAQATSSCLPGSSAVCGAMRGQHHRVAESACGRDRIARCGWDCEPCAFSLRLALPSHPSTAPSPWCRKRDRAHALPFATSDSDDNIIVCWLRSCLDRGYPCANASVPTSRTRAGHQIPTCRQAPVAPLRIDNDGGCTKWCTTARAALHSCTLCAAAKAQVRGMAASLTKTARSGRDACQARRQRVAGYLARPLQTAHAKVPPQRQVVQRLLQVAQARGRQHVTPVQDAAARVHP